jgi:hypothetical protein
MAVVILHLKAREIHKIMTEMILHPTVLKILKILTTTKNSLTKIPHNPLSQTPSGFLRQEVILRDT